MKIKFEAKDYSILDAITNWNDWEELNEIYNSISSSFKRISDEDIERDFNRQEVIINGVAWKPLSREYVCDNAIDLEVFNNNLQHLVYEKLENVSLKERISVFEGFNQSCFHCGIRTYQMELKTCPICNRSLTTFVVNWSE